MSRNDGAAGPFSDRSCGVILLIAACSAALSGANLAHGQERSVAIVAENHWTSRIVAEMAACPTRPLEATVEKDHGVLKSFVAGRQQILAMLKALNC